MLDDVRVWRAIINGFPYKTPAEMGVDNDLDAYTATKHAIYTILYDRNPATFYRGGDERGTKIYNAIVNLTNIGRYGTQTPQNANPNINKVGELYEDGEYYSQRYSVTSAVNISDYNIVATANMPQGAYISDLNNNVKTNFAGGEQFKVRIPKSSMNSDVSLDIALQVKCATYPIFFGKSPNSAWQDYAVTYDPYGDESAVTTLNVKSNTGSIKVVKVDEETKESVQGVTFELKDNSGNVIQTKTTDINGNIVFGELYQGNYTIKEISTNEHYILNDTEFNISVEYNKMMEIEVTNKHKKGNIKITKVDLDEPNITLGAVEFDLLESDGTFITSLVTNVNGEIEINNINTGNYILRETLTNNMYELNKSDVGITVKWNETTDLQVTNEKKKGQVRIIKVDLDNNEVKLAGVEFEVIDSQDRIIEKIITDSNGIAITSRLPIGEYKIRETKTLEHYILNEEIKTIVLEANEIKDMTFENEQKKGQIEITKVDIDNNEVKIEGVKFNIISNSSGEIVDTIVTDKNGEAITKMIPIADTYTIKEIETNYKYDLSNKEYTASVKWNEVTKLEIENEKKKGQIEVIKVDLENNEVRLAGVEFEVLDKDMNVIEKLITNENGEAITSRLPAIDEIYYIRETKTLDNYVLNDTIQKVELKADEITTMTFENEKIKGKIQITKISAEDNKYSELLKGSVLENSVFEIYDSNNDLVDTITTNSEGIATSKLLLKGTYYIKEIEASKYYILNENTYEIELVEHLKVENITIENDNVELDIEIEKNGFIESQSRDNVFYKFKNIENKSNVSLDNFIWNDTLPTNAVRIDKLYTGTWNEELKYNVYYKTNMSEDFILFKEDLDTSIIYELNFKELDLKKDEYVTEFEFRFDTVKSGFKEVEQPILFCDLLDELGNGFIFDNITKISGNYFDKYVEDKDNWTTITYEKDIKSLENLPKTGK